MPVVSEDEEEEKTPPCVLKKPLAPLAISTKLLFGAKNPVPAASDAAATTTTTKSRIVCCSSAQLRSKVDDMLDAGFKCVHVFPMNMANRLQSRIATTEPIHELRGGNPGANFDVCEPAGKDLWEPGHAEITGLAVAAFDIADLINRSGKTAAVICSNKGADAPRTLACCARLALRTIDKKKAKLALKGQAPVPKSAMLKAFVQEFATFKRDTAVSMSEQFYRGHVE